MKLPRLVRRLAIGLAALLAAVALPVVLLISATLPPRLETLHIPGLSAPVQVVFDRYGIPFIRAANRLDAATALGFVHARDRLFQMDLMRRAATGQLSALFGPATLSFDEFMRRLDLAHAAAAILLNLPASVRAMLDSYASGVNAFIAASGRFAAPEFLPFGPPKPWTATDSLLWGEWMAFSLSDSWRVALDRLALSAFMPPAKVYELWPQEGGPGKPALAAANPAEGRALEAMLAEIPGFPAPFTLPATASNEWAVGPPRSATGAPLLAGDPHLGYGLPGIWYLARIDTPHETLAGATTPGVPFFILGRNRFLAWTFTDTGAATTDIFVETVLPDGKYVTPAGPRPFATRKEVIRVSGRKPVTITLRFTRHGPVIGWIDHHRKALALDASFLAPGNTAAAGLSALNRSRNLAEAESAAAKITAPIQNLLVADRSHIGLFVTGRVPIRRSGNGSFPASGASGAGDWIGWATALPRYVDPLSGVLANANERIAPPDFPVFLGRDWPGDWRGRRIRALLTKRPKATVADFVAMQHDVTSLYARAVLPYLLAIRPQPGLPARAASLLAGWNGRMGRDAPQPLIFNAWLRAFHRAVLRRNHVPLSASGPGHNGFVLWLLAGHGGADWCGGDCRPLLRAALSTAVAELARRYGNDPARWRWGRAHRSVFAHPILGRVPVLAWLTDAVIATSGDDTTIDRASPGPKNFDSVHGPAYRGVYDLADLDASRFIIAPGESGNPFSPHARDLVHRWRDGRPLTLPPMPAHPAARLTLLP